MTTKEMIEVMQAYADGKQIQVTDGFGDEWQDISNPVWDWHTFNYRVKPEPKYRPFNSAEEVMEAIKEHGDWVKSTGGTYEIIRGVKHTDVNISGTYFSRTTVFDKYKFLDGTPFGKLEE